MAVLRENGPLRHLTLEPKTAKPSIRKVEMNLFAEPGLGSNAIEISHQQHSY
jgi:hypothetical protein